MQAPASPQKVCDENETNKKNDAHIKMLLIEALYKAHTKNNLNELQVKDS